MAVQNRVIQKLSEIFHCRETPENTIYDPQRELTPSYEQISRALIKAQGEWFSAIATLETLLLSKINPCTTHNPTYEGLILSSPTPVLSHSRLLSCFYSGVFTAEILKYRALMPSQPASEGEFTVLPHHTATKLPLFLQDPLAGEQFCLVLTPHFGLLMVLGEDERGLPSFDFSFDPEAIQQSWMALRSRLDLVNHPQLSQLDILTEQFSPPTPDYKVVMEFSRQLLKNLPEPTPESRRVRCIETPSTTPDDHQLSVISVAAQYACDEQKNVENCSPDVELLQALTHEIRTPLTTIRTMTRLLMKRAKLTPDMTKCLEVIDQECTEQINRMELIFRATEWGTTAQKDKRVQLVPISVEQVFEQSIPRWKKQAQRRNVDLDVVLPKKLPQVVSDPAMLEQMLTGLMEKFTRSVTTGGYIRVEVTLAGNQLKLQFNSHSSYQHNPFKALGQLLLFQPDTGSLSLNLDITKNLFEALGGKLIVRQRPHQGEVLTVFLPLGGNRR
ncbi:sensor histidine kinase [Gloeothece verrucosa]|uniref:histidine kinase n=1 Tax=Gloeothece verrucosa (strain PCC 7822) TaxID=497965 RepID=E0UI99_GLOV7|nr:HAMP domain-containing sensor histidine kinase [Gloeothece verrucosa]ADN16867.1 histidine kinase [Gloeothece verrucosa PCC 7822]